MIFLWIIWEFHIVYLITLTFYPFHFCAPIVMVSPLKRKIKKKRTTQSNLCCPYNHWTVVKLPVPSILKKSESGPPLPLSVAINCGELLFSFFITNFIKFSSTTFCLGCYFWGVGGWGYRSIPCLSFSIVSPQPPSIPLQKNLPCPLLSLGGQVLGFHMVPGDSMDHRHSYGLWHQPMPWTSAWSPVAVTWPTDRAGD